MSFTLNRYAEFIGRDRHRYRVEVLKDGTFTPVECKMGPIPFVVHMPTVGKYEVIRGTGFEMSLLRDLTRDLTDLYTEDMKGVQVKFYRTLLPQGDEYNELKLIFFGWLDPEMYEDDFSQGKNYLVSFTGTDGMNILDRLFFMEDEETKYTGIKSQWELLQIALTATGFTFQSVNICPITTFTGQSESVGVSILHDTYEQCSNYYDEDGEAMSMREVIESILAPHGYLIQIIDNHVYINNRHGLHSAANQQYMRYVDWTYEKLIRPLERRDIANIGYAGSSGTRRIKGGLSRQMITYSRYTQDDLFTDDDNIGKITPVDIAPALNASGYYETPIAGETNELAHENWFWSAGSSAIGTYFSGTKGDAQDATEYSLKFANRNSPDTNPLFANTPDLIATTVNGPYVVGKTGQGLLIELDAFIKAKTNPYSSDQEDAIITNLFLFLKVKVGDYCYDYQINPTDKWAEEDLTVGNEQRVRAIIANWSNTEIISNQWINGNVIVPLIDGLSGVVSIGFYSYFNVYPAGFDYSAISQIWVRNVNVSSVKCTADPIDAVFNPATGTVITIKNRLSSTQKIDTNDIERIGKINRLFKNDGGSIKLTTGTSYADGSGYDRGGLMYVPDSDYPDLYQYIKEWTRAGYTGTIEENLMRSVMSNFETSSVMLDGLKLCTSQYRNTHFLTTEVAPLTVVAVATSNITLSGEQTINGVAVVEGNLVLAKGQTDASKNGIYYVYAGAWVRSEWADEWSLIVGAKIFSSYPEEKTVYYCTAQAGGTMDTTDQFWYMDKVTFFTTFTEAENLDTAVLLPSGGAIDYRNGVFECTLEQIFSDTANIVLE